MGLATAFKFLTVIPLPGNRQLDAGALGASLPWFPLVGLAIGGLLGGLYYAFDGVLPPLLFGALAVVLLAAVSGAHHLDGLVDTFDGLAASGSPAQRLAAMAGGPAGPHGVTAAAVLLLVKFAALTAIGNWLALVLVPVLGRNQMVSVLYLFPAARREGMAHAFKGGATLPRFLVSNIITLALALSLLWPSLGLARGAGLAIGGWCIMCAVAWFFCRRFGGLNGDTLGAMGETSEALALLLLVALL